MEENNSKYEDAHSRGSNSDIYIDNNIYMNYSNRKYSSQGKENKRYNNMPEKNIIMKNSDNNNNNNSVYSSPRENETIFETEKNISYCSTCTCTIF